MDSDDIVKALGSLETSNNILTEEIHKLRAQNAEALSICQSFEEHKAATADHGQRIVYLEKIAEMYIRETPAREAESKYLNNLRTNFRAGLLALGFTNAVILTLVSVGLWLLKSGYVRVGL